MRRLALFLFILLSFNLVACGQTPESHQRSISADVLYTNGIIWTGETDPQGQYQQASILATKDGKIVYVGEGKDVHFEANTEIDLQQKFMLAGFVDNHVHFFEGGAALASVDLRDADSPNEFSQRIAQFADKTPEGRWILNGNWDHENWGGALPRKEWIDTLTPHNPVFVIRLDGHMALANSAALALANIDKNTSAPLGGEIVKDRNGELTGVIKGNALNLILNAIPQPDDTQVLDMFTLAQDHALSLGLTKVHAVTANPTETNMLDHFRMAKASGKMKLRAYVYTPIEHWQQLKSEVETRGTGDELLAWGGVKGFVDGSLGAQTAWFNQPYVGTTDFHGHPLTEPKLLSELITGADSANLRVAIHGIGDKAIHEVLSIFQRLDSANSGQKRFRIEHFQHPNQQSITQLSQHKVIASMQPYHAIDDGRWAEEKIGAKRIKTTYAFKSILDAGGILTFGSDWPVAPLSPLEGVYAAVTRRTTDDKNPEGWIPTEKISVEQALHAYTAANAYAGFEEDTAGTLAVNKRADMVVLSADPRHVQPQDIPDIKVLQTIIDGEVVYQQSN